MKTKLLSQALTTGDITVMSNVTSVTVAGTKVSRVEEVPGHEQESPSSVHIDFEVKQPSHLPAVLADTETLGMILQLEDAVELGLLLVAMGLEHKTPNQVADIISRLTRLAEEFA
jgi:hypothetical protein